MCVKQWPKWSQNHALVRSSDAITIIFAAYNQLAHNKNICNTGGKKSNQFILGGGFLASLGVTFSEYQFN